MKRTITGFLIAAILVLFMVTALAQEPACTHDWQLTDSTENCEMITNFWQCSLCNETRVEEISTGETHKITHALLYDYCSVLLYGCPYCDTVLSEEKGPIEHDYFNTLNHAGCAWVSRTCPRCHAEIIYSTLLVDDHHQWVEDGDFFRCAVCGETKCRAEGSDASVDVCTWGAPVNDSVHLTLVYTCSICGRQKREPMTDYASLEGTIAWTVRRDVRICQQPDSLAAELIPTMGSKVLVLEFDISSEANDGGELWARAVYDGVVGFVPQSCLTTQQPET